MRKSGILLAACLLVATPVLAGDMPLNGGQAVWHSTKCAKPLPPLNSERQCRNDRRSDERACLPTQRLRHSRKSYMKCVSDEAENDRCRH